MGSKISQLNELDTLTGNEQGVVAYNGANFRFPLKKIAGLVTKTDLGLEKVNNTSDQEKPVSTLQQQALDGKSNTNHTHAIAGVNGLEEALDGKAPTDHHHQPSDVDGLVEALDNKAALVHNHEISSVNGLQNALEGKSNNGHKHSVNDVNGLAAALQAQTEAIQQRAPMVHDHDTSQIEGLSEYVDQKIEAAGITAEVVFPNQEW